MVAIFLPADPLDSASQRSKFNFSELGQVAYQIKEINECSNMVELFCLQTPTLDPGGQKVKIQLFQNMVMLHIKLKGIINKATLE